MKDMYALYGGLDMRRITKHAGTQVAWRLDNASPWNLSTMDELAKMPNRLDIYEMYILPK